MENFKIIILTLLSILILKYTYYLLKLRKNILKSILTL